MVENWITSPAGRKVIGTFADAKPAWLWSGDGKDLIWANPAARLRGAKSKKRRLKLAPVLTPIKGQVARLMRLGALGRSSLSRMQFTLGKKPVSATCTCTPLTLENSAPALMIVEVDAIDRDLMADHWCAEDVLKDIFGSETPFAVYDENGDLIAGEHRETTSLKLAAGPHGEEIAFFDTNAPEAALVDHLNSDDLDEVDTEIEDTKDVSSPVPVEEASDVAASADIDRYAPEHSSGDQPEKTPIHKDNDDKPERHRDLSALLEKLSDNGHIFEPLSEIDDEPLPLDEGGETNGVATQVDAVVTDEATLSPRSSETDDDIESDDSVPDDADELNAMVSEPETQNHDAIEDDGLWQVVGRGFDKHFDAQEPQASETRSDSNEDHRAAQISDQPETPAPAEIEQTSRYNFAELSRILNDRIAGERAEVRGGEMGSKDQNSAPSAEPPAGELVNLSDETLVLNRLPLGLLIFRDQQILFVNRSMTDLVGYPDSVSLRAQGLEGVFPRHDNDEDPLGPVTHLAHRNGGRVPVSARLQAVSWQGAPALMLTAKSQASMQGVEGAIRSFAEQFAGMQGCGYFETSRAGIISSISGRGSELFGRTPQVMIGRPLMLMADHQESEALRAFLEQAARKAETTRPSIILRGIDPRINIYLFAEGQAGFVTGYFGFVQRRTDESQTAATAIPSEPKSNIDPTILTRLGRDIRRPLNSIIGFAELLQSHAFGPIENARYAEYARDIKHSGQDIARSVDELEELVRIDSGDYMVAPVEFDLAALLDTNISRVRASAERARVFVRSAISEQLPRIRADEASLGQALLNLLASAIEQTPPGGHVIVSAQREDDWSIAIHVRNSGGSNRDIEEQFVVFRDGAEGHASANGSQASSVGLALTRSLLAINTCTLAIEPGSGQTTILSLLIPAALATDVD